ncbi:MAG: 5-dehydro-4-deoxy-D-glucuronate isomerase [Bacteroidetes bacterium GWE2_41_25]|nr:MAG: 5-dehydro-4-deoxy-D-glucuronate isomerase [Bacteroidetes bacterium GWA2_40_15]OFX96108.1 MAG: 5-dehydro-4-deoxy-D-glucuronate isomerase [Bacteroidetes bacterium GWE2_41_25]OFY00513.1 MAG: 5-dehydro-4-deoxy-D-glucuronate isomerase [Bacteroidetes bacterium GWC2_40_22]OFY61151.1 MAG: 5-dehydro-4-deoxy-D-glucuronate isomerase [Bacteroidetes bacterium GWF2_41_9]HAM10322.1 5-dehydro-4-deoxy-D-glucuronate isomerase [Bacteroidales bacterium]
MKTELRYASHPQDVKKYGTEELRKAFLIQDIFQQDEITLVYSMYDRLIAGGAMPVNMPLKLEATDELKAKEFLERREIGIINVGGDSEITASGTVFKLGYKEALYLGKGTTDVIFSSKESGKPARFYFNSAPAHQTYPSKKVSISDGETVVLGNMESSNHRAVNKLLVNSVLQTCQLQMGMTELKPGSVWNTMPVHTHSRRMEAYFYFEVPEKQGICHFMGEPDETRHIWMKNEEAVLSPSWSIHSAAGTSNYTFIWGMAGENLDYGDMDVRHPDTLK